MEFTLEHCHQTPLADGPGQQTVARLLGDEGLTVVLCETVRLAPSPESSAPPYRIQARVEVPRVPPAMTLASVRALEDPSLARTAEDEARIVAFEAFELAEVDQPPATVPLAWPRGTIQDVLRQLLPQADGARVRIQLPAPLEGELQAMAANLPPMHAEREQGWAAYRALKQQVRQVAPATDSATLEASLPGPSPMKFTLTDIRAESSQERDYDTAVDLVSIFSEELYLTLSTEAGLRLQAVIFRSTSTHSYLEPDFDHYEATGTTVYQEHDDASRPDETQESQRVNVLRLDTIEPVLTVEEWRLRGMLELGGEYPTPSAEQQARVDAYEIYIQEGGATWDFGLIRLPEGDVRALCEAAEAAEEGTVFDVSLSPAGEAAVREMEGAEQTRLAQHQANVATNAMHHQLANQTAVRASLGQRLAEASPTQVSPAQATPPRSFLRRILGR